MESVLDQLKQIKHKLPSQYGKQISKQTGIGTEQIRRVFKGEITNPEIVNKVLAESLNLIKMAGDNEKMMAKLVKATAA